MSTEHEARPLKSGYEGHHGTPMSVCGPDTRVQIAPTSSPPYRSICHLEMTFDDGRYSGSGWLYDAGAGRLLVLTAAHNLRGQDMAPATSVTITPAADGKHAPYGFQTVTSGSLYVPYAYVRTNTESDYGAIVVNRTSKWDSFLTPKALSTTALYDRICETAGYPGDKPERTLWLTGDSLHNISDTLLHYYHDTYAGQSGGPVWSFSEGQWCAVGVHIAGSCPNRATRISSSVLAQIARWCDKQLDESIQDDDWNSSYSPPGGLGPYYADTNELICPAGKVIVGYSFWQKNNRLAPAIYAAFPDGTGIEEIKNTDMNGNYLGPLRDIYADTNTVRCNTGQYATGFSFYKKQNRLAPRLRSSNIDGTNASWISYEAMNQSYFLHDGALAAIYADTNELFCSSVLTAVTSFALRQKGGNRIAPILWARMIG